METQGGSNLVNDSGPDSADGSKRCEPNETKSEPTAASSEEASVVTMIDSEYLTGMRLYLLVFGLSISYFLILLNSTVVVTVSQPIRSFRSGHSHAAHAFHGLGYSANHQ